MPYRREKNYLLLVFLGISILMHMLLALFLAAWFLFASQWRSSHLPERALELTLISPPTRPPAPTAEPAKERFANASESTKTEKPVETTPFIGEQNTQAASEVPNTSESHLPKQEGAPIPGLSLKQSEFATDMQQRQASQQPEKEPSEQPPDPNPKPEQEPQTAEASQPPPSVSDHVPLRPEGTLYTNDTPAEKGKEKTEEPGKSTQVAATAPRSPPASFSAASPYRRKTQLDGSTTQTGNSSIAIRETELGRYKQKLFNAIGSRWHLYVRSKGSLLEVGMVRLRFTVQADGKVTNIQIVHGENLPALLSICRQSVFEVGQQMEPFSPSMRQQLGDEYTEEVSFTIY